MMGRGAVEIEAVLVALDVGTSKAVALVGEVTREGAISVIGKGIVPASGLKKGVVNNIEQTVASIRAAVEAAERLSGMRLEAAFVGVGGSQVESLNSRGAVAVSGPHREVTRRGRRPGDRGGACRDHPLQPGGAPRPAARLHGRRAGGRQGPHRHECRAARGGDAHRARLRDGAPEPDQVRPPGGRARG